jgi:hypothetical protein
MVEQRTALPTEPQVVGKGELLPPAQQRIRRGQFTPDMAEERLAIIQELNRRGVRTPFDEAMNIDISTGLENIPTRIKLGFASSPEARLNALKQSHPDAKRLEDGRLAYRNPKTQQLTLVDEEGMSIGDLADAVGALPEIIGGTVGAIAAAPLPVPGARFVGAGLGSAAGRLAKEGIGRGLGIQEPKGTLAREVAKAGVTGAIGEGIGAGVIKLSKPFARKVTPSLLRGIDKFRLHGGQLSPAQATESRGLDFIENIAENSFFGAEPFRKFRTSQEGAVSRFADNLVDRLGPRLNPEEIGELFLSAAEGKRDAFSAAAKGLYREVDELSKLVRVPTSSIKKTAEILDKRLIVRDPVTGKPSAPSLQSRTIIRILNDMKGLRDSVTFSEAQSFRSDLLGITRSTVTGELLPGKVVSALNELGKSFDTAITKQGNELTPEALRAFRRANSMWKQGKEFFNDKLITSLLKKAPEEIGKAVFKPKRVTQIRQIKRFVGNDPFEKMTQGWLETVLEPNPVTGITEGSTLLRRLATMGDDTLKEMFDIKHLEDIKDFAVVTERSQRPGEGLGRALVQFTQGAVALNFLRTGASAEAGVTLLGPAALAKIMTNKQGIKWLTQGLRISPNSKEGISIGAKLMSLMAKENLFPSTAPNPEEVANQPSQ